MNDFLKEISSLSHQEIDEYIKKNSGNYRTKTIYPLLFLIPESEKDNTTNNDITTNNSKGD